MYRGSDLQPLTAEELLLVEKIISGNFSFLYANKALGQRKAEKKWKWTMPNTSVFDDHPVAVLSAPGGLLSRLWLSLRGRRSRARRKGL